nr:MAG TPA: hypothetical protein [Caudoviricetes sp.]
MAIKLNEITNFTHKKTAMLSGADLPLLVKVTSLETQYKVKKPFCKRGFSG